MKKLAIALCTSLCLAIPSYAQSAPTADDAPAGAASGGGKASKKQVPEFVQACRKTAREQGMKPGSKEMKQAVMDCVAKDHPGMANRMKCQQSGREKGMKPGSDEMKAYVKDCAHKG